MAETEARRLGREEIIDALTAELRPLASVHAFYEGGAAAFNRLDGWSDIDLYAIVDEGAVLGTFHAVERALTALSPIRIQHEVSWPPASGITQRFYRLERASEFLIVDLAVVTVSAPDKYLAREIHGDAVVFFDKDGAARPPPLDAADFLRRMLERRARLQERMALFGPFVPKEIQRGNWLEALEYYRAIVLPSLVEALRMRHGPFHYDFRMRYVNRELPPEAVRKLEDLAFVKDSNDLGAKYERARSWFDEVFAAFDEGQARTDVGGDRA